MANLRRQMIDMTNDHADKIQRLHYCVVFVGIIAFSLGIISSIIYMTVAF